MVRFPPLLSPLFLLLHLLLFATSSEAGLFRGSARPTPLQQLKTRVQSEDKKALTFLRGDFELSCWLRVTGGDVDEACRRVLEKAEWRKGVGKVTMADCARGFGSDGYALQLGGLFDRRGCPLVYSHGLPRGSEAQIRSMTVYMQERVLDACAQNSGGGRRGRGGGGGGGGGGYEGGGGRRPYCAPLTIIDCTQPSFRSPDGALRRGGIDVVSRYYPWSREGTTLFLGVPRAMTYVFKVARPFFPADLYDRFRFAESPGAIVAGGYVAPHQLPRALGGSSGWSLRTYVPRRCLAEGALCKAPPKTGPLWSEGGPAS